MFNNDLFLLINQQKCMYLYKKYIFFFTQAIIESVLKEKRFSICTYIPKLQNLRMYYIYLFFMYIEWSDFFK